MWDLGLSILLVAQKEPHSAEQYHWVHWSESQNGMHLAQRLDPDSELQSVFLRGSVLGRKRVQQ